MRSVPPLDLKIPDCFYHATHAFLDSRSNGPCARWQTTGEFSCKSRENNNLVTPAVCEVA